MRHVQGFLAAAVVVFSAPTFASSSAQVAHNVPPWLSLATLVGPADGNGQTAVAIHLQLSNVAGLQTFLHDLYTPGTASYGKYLTPEQFRAAYSPSASAVAAVQSFLSQKGLTVTYTPANGMYVEATGSVSQIAKAFGVSQNLYNLRGHTLRANKEPPTIPASLVSFVSFVEGLDDTETLLQSGARIRGMPTTPAAPPPYPIASPPPCSTFWADHAASVNPGAYQYGSALPWANCGYTPQQVRAAYGVNRVPWTGAGVRVGITDAFASPTIVDDVNRFSAHYGLPLLTSSNFQQVVVPGTLNFPENRQDPATWYLEETLDIEWVHVIAPGASIVFAGAQNNGVPNSKDPGTQTLSHALIHLIDNHLVDIITNSWGYGGAILQYGLVQPTEAAFMQAGAEGISVVFSSGDWGDNLFLGSLSVAQALYPAESPYVTAVGGTTLAIHNAAGDKDEWGWSTYVSNLLSSAVSTDGTQVGGSSWSPWPPQPIAFLGSSGGAGADFAQPDYQQGVVPSLLSITTVDSNGTLVSYSSPRRVVPDVAMNADIWSSTELIGATFTISSDSVANAGCITLTSTTEYCEALGGGTSIASPKFAGVLALTNQARSAVGKGLVGFVNPALYGLHVGPPGSSAPIVDVLPPKTPIASMFNSESSGIYEVQLFTINSLPTGTTGPVVEGADSSLRTTPGYDNVTGLGTPNVPAFIEAFTNLP
jgi:subtilase family serine protease